MKHIFSVIFALLLFSGIVNAQVVERSVEAIEYLQTNYEMIYQGVHIPMLDISYHEWSSDSVTWRKNYVDGDCYLRISNDVKDTWVGINMCGEGTGTSLIDSIVICSNGVCDTIATGTVTVSIPAPISITGSTGNTQTDLTHTHDITFYMGDVEDVDVAGAEDGQILKWNATSGTWVVADDLTGAGASGELTVRDVDLTPSISNVTTINIEDGHLTDDGAGAVTIDFSLNPSTGKQDFFRTDTVDVAAGDAFLTFSSPLPANDYVVASAYALYPDGERQTLSYDSTAADGFRVLNVLGESEVHYLVIRDLDSIGVILDSYGKVGASSNDVLGFLDSKTDDSTITVIDNQLVFMADTVDINQITSDEFIFDGDTLRNTTQLTNADTTIATEDWVLSVAGAGNGWDSLTWNANSGYVSWWYAGVALDSVSTLGRYVELDDATTGYVTPTQLMDSIENANGLRTMIYDIKLPSASSLNERILAMSEGDAFDLGWTLTVNGTVDLDIQHNLNRRVVSVAVFVVTGSEEQELYDTAAHNGLLSMDLNNVRIRSLATSFLSKDIVVYLTFK